MGGTGARAAKSLPCRARTRSATRTLLVLTLTTGVIDAASYLGLGRVFAANMTGNVVLLGFGIAGSSGLPVVAPLVSLGAFLAGAVLGGRMAAMLPPKAAHLARAMIIEVALIALATLIAIVFDITPDRFSGDLIIGLLAFAMGVRNATVRRLKVADLTTTVLTMTLTGLAADSPHKNYQEDQLLPRQWDPSGHAVGILAPGGCHGIPRG